MLFRTRDARRILNFKLRTLCENFSRRKLKSAFPNTNVFYHYDSIKFRLCVMSLKLVYHTSHLFCPYQETQTKYF